MRSLKILTCRVAFLGSAFMFHQSLRAQALDGFVSPAIINARQIKTPANAVSSATNASATTDEAAGRMRYELQFGRLQRNIEFDLNMGSGGGYDDYGATFRFFNHFLLGERGSSGISVGLGLGARTSSGGIWAANDTSSSLRKFTEYTVTPFARYIWDSVAGIGAAAEVGFEVVPKRVFSDGLGPSSDSSSRVRLIIGATFMLNSRWLE